jgi:hypothetical protein
MNTCPKCVSEITINARFCPECGNQLSRERPDAVRTGWIPERLAEERYKKKWLSILAIVLAICAAVSFWLYTDKDKTYYLVLGILSAVLAIGYIAARMYFQGKINRLTSELEKRQNE